MKDMKKKKRQEVNEQINIYWHRQKGFRDI